MMYHTKTGALMANSHPGSYCGQDAYTGMLIVSGGTARMSQERSLATTQLATNGCPTNKISGGVLQMYDENVEYVVRRLTPTECARLQGFPDDWGKLDGKPYSESAEYKMWGNGIALPCALYVMEGIAKEMGK